MARKSRFRSKKGSTEALQKRTDKAIGSRGGKWKPIFKNSAKFQKWVCRPGDHIIDIIPYLDNNDDFQYKLELMVHQRIGPDEGNYICPKTFDSSADCPLCSARNIAQAEEEEDLAKLLRPRDRVVYNIVCYDSNKEEDKGVQVWEASNYLAEENFQAAAKKRKKGGGGGKVSFADPDDGKTISWEHTGTGVGTRYVGFAMEERDEPITDEILDEAYILEDLIDIPTVEMLQEQADIVMSLGTSTEQEEKPERKSRTRRPSKEEEPEEEPKELEGTGDDVPLDYDEEKEKPTRTRRRSLKSDDSEKEDSKKPTRRTRQRR